MFQIADRRRRGIDDYVDSTLVKWKQILPEVQANSEKNGDKDNDSNPSSPTKAAKVKGTLQLKRKGQFNLLKYWVYFLRATLTLGWSVF